MIPDLAGALYVPDYRALLVADLHLEKGSSRATRGYQLPPYDTRSTLAVLKGAIARHRPDIVIALGDSFHDRSADARLAEDDRACLAGLRDLCDFVWITGNHDPVLPRACPGPRTSELALGPLTLRHEPSETPDGEIAGHLHPAATVSRRGRRLKGKCFAVDERRIVMPALGAYTGGLGVWSQAFRSIFPDGRFTVWMLGRAAIHRIASTRLSRLA